MSILHNPIYVGLPKPQTCDATELERRIAEKRLPLRSFLVSASIRGRRIEQTVLASSTNGAALIAFDVLGLPCASVRPL